MSSFHRLRVRETRVEIGGLAKSVCFDIPEGLRETFRWRAGQHITVRFGLNGEEVRRPYSISSSPMSGDPLRITVKRVEDGLVSNHINDTVEAGDEIDVASPFGGFCLDTDGRARRTYYLFGAGSGITPLFSMLHSVLCDEPHSVVHLVYGNRGEKTILFREELEDLVGQHPERLTVAHVFSRPSMWSSFSPWRKGLVDAAVVEATIAEHPPYAQDTQYYVCGPGGMNGTVISTLTSLDVPRDRIHQESYGGSVESDDSVAGVAATASLVLEAVETTVTVDAAETVLEAARRHGLKPPFSCQSGVCGACRARLTDGSVHMRARMALNDAEIAGGAILTCQSVATSERVRVVFDP